MIVFAKVAKFHQIWSHCLEPYWVFIKTKQVQSFSRNSGIRTQMSSLSAHCRCLGTSNQPAFAFLILVLFKNLSSHQLR